MNRQSSITFLIVAGVVLFLSCNKARVYFFTASDMEWMPYDTASFQGNYVNENGDTFALQLLSRNVSHYTIDGTNDQGNRAVLVLKLDTIRMDLTMFKERRTGRCFMEIPDLWMDLKISDFNVGEIGEWGLDGSFQPIQVGTITYPEAVELIRDTIAAPQISCWRVYYGKDEGLIRADFRNGSYYQRQ